MAEAGPTQYDGDFWGLYLAVEEPDRRMLQEHNLGDGNLYKIEEHKAIRKNQASFQVDDMSDVTEFIRAYRMGRPTPEWWREHFDVDKYLSYRAVVDSIHHYDIAGGSNALYFHNPTSGKFEVHPWDVDMTWSNRVYGTGRHAFRHQIAWNRSFRSDFQNRLRECCDLLFTPEQVDMLIDAYAAFIYTPGQPSIVDADRARWDYNPILTSRQIRFDHARHGQFYVSSRTRDFAGMVDRMKEYAMSRCQWIQRQLLTNEDEIPQHPKILLVSDSPLTADNLRFSSSPFEDPTGASFSGIEWRLAEVTNPHSSGFDKRANRPKYEITTTWESGVLQHDGYNIVIPAASVVIERTYRVRARVRNASSLWSHWSAPVQITVRATPE